MVTMPGQPIDSYSPEGEAQTKAITAREPAPYKPEMGLQVKPKADANPFGQNLEDPNRRLAQRAEAADVSWKERFVQHFNNSQRYGSPGIDDLGEIRDAKQGYVAGQAVDKSTGEATAGLMIDRRAEKIAEFEGMKPAETPGDYAAAIGGAIAGSIVDPISLINAPVKIGSAGWRIAAPYLSRMLDSGVSNAAMNAAINATVQAEEYGAGIRDEVDWLSLGVDTAAGGLLGVPFGAVDGAAAARETSRPARTAPPAPGQAPMAPRPQRAEPPPPQGIEIPTPEAMQAEYTPAELSQAQVDLFGEVIGTRNMTPEQIAQVDDYLNGGKAADIPQAEPETEGGLTNDVPPPEPRPDLSTDPAKVTGTDSVPAIQIGGKYFTGESHADALEKAMDQFGINSPEIKAFEDAEDANAFIGVIRPKQGWIQGIVSGRQDGFVPGITGGKPEDLTAQIDAARETTPVAEAASPEPRVAPPPPLPIDRTERQFSPSDLKVDAKRFQFKEGGDEAGVTDRLKGVKRWDPIKSGVTLVWEDLNGDFYIADGHQRHGLASRLEKEGQEPKIRAVVLREADGVTSEDARAIAAAKNIAEGTGNAVDAAKILRSRPDMGVDLPPTSALVRDAQGLATLSDDAFGMVINKKVPAGYAAQVGRLAPDPKTHAELLGLLAKEQPDNAIEAESMIRDALEAPAVQSTMEDMFGSAEVTQILFKERAQVLSAAATAIRKDRAAFATLVREEARLTGAGNQLATQTNAERAAQDAEILATLQAQARRKGPIADALAAAAKRLKDGDSRQIVVRDFLNDLRRSSAPTGADGGVPGAAGRPDETGIAARLEPGAPAFRATDDVSGTYYVARIQRQGSRSVRGKNAGNLGGVARHAGQLDDFDSPAFAGGSGNSIAVYKITAPPQKAGKYERSNKVGAQATSSEIGVDLTPWPDGKARIAYSFGKDANFTEELITEVPLEKAKEALSRIYPQSRGSFDEAGDLLSAQAIGEAIDEALQGQPAMAFSAPRRGQPYPIAPRSEWYGDANFEQTGGRMVTMTPDEFLAQVRPLEMDEVARENIEDLKAHIRSGKTLDPLAIYKGGREDGRHRAIAAQELGIAEVPVLVWDDGIAFSRRRPPPGPGLFDAPAPRAEPDRAAELKAKIAAARQPGFELGADNKPQAVIPGAERISDKRLAEMRAKAPLKASRAQKQLDIGLFSDDADQQGFAFRDEMIGTGLPDLIANQAPIEEIANHPFVLDAVRRMAAVPLTHKQPGYMSPEWKAQRTYSFKDGEVVGYDNAITKLTEGAKAFSTQGPVKAEKVATILLGPPAAGKSTHAEKIAAARFAAIVDPDEAKNVIPEMDGGIGANAVHEESAEMAADILYRLMKDGSNLVIPKVGQSTDGIRKLVLSLKREGYRVNLVGMNVTYENAFRRMIGRFMSKGRLINPEYVAEVGIKPTTTYRELRAEGVADGYAEIDGNGGLGQIPQLLDDGGGLEGVPGYGPGRGGNGNLPPEAGPNGARARGRNAKELDPLTQPGGEWRDIDIMAVDEAGKPVRVNAGDAVDFMVTRINSLRQLLECVNAG